MTSTGTADHARSASTPDELPTALGIGTADHAPPPASTPIAAPSGGGTESAQPVASPPPLWWSRDFPGEPRQVSHARSWVAKLLPACAPLDDLLIFTSELASNAVTHTRSGQPGGQFTVEVTWNPRTARIVVGDQGSHEVPVTAAIPGAQDAFLESGRGLLLVDMMSAAWGMAGDATARWLWADVDWRSQGGPLPNAPVDSNSPKVQFVAMSCAYPGTSAWYSDQSGQYQFVAPVRRVGRHGRYRVTESKLA